MAESPATPTPTRFRKRPVEIEAIQWDGTASGATPIINWILDGDGTARYFAPGEWDDNESSATYLVIDTLEGSMLASPGDWVIRGVQGEHYPCKPDIFAVTYEPPGDTERERIRNEARNELLPKSEEDFHRLWMFDPVFSAIVKMARARDREILRRADVVGVPAAQPANDEAAAYPVGTVLIKGVNEWEEFDLSAALAALDRVKALLGPHIDVEQLDDWSQGANAALRDVRSALLGGSDTAQDTTEPPSQGCEVPPLGWYCSRAPGHDGPCAMRPVN